MIKINNIAKVKYAQSFGIKISYFCPFSGLDFTTP